MSGGGGGGLPMDVQWPLDSVFVALEAEAARRRGGDVGRGGSRFAVLLSTGSLNPVHLGHISVLESARDCLERNGFTVLCGLLSPSSDLYVEPKCARNKSLFIPGVERVRLVRLLLSEKFPPGAASWLHASEWELRQPNFVDFGPVAEALSCVIGADTRLTTLAAAMGGDLTTFYCCGEDLWSSAACHYFSDPYHPSRAGVVVVPRAGKYPNALNAPSDERLCFVANPPSDAVTTDLSSTKLRKALESGADLASFLLPRTAAELRRITGHQQRVGGRDAPDAIKTLPERRVRVLGDFPPDMTNEPRVYLSLAQGPVCAANPRLQHLIPLLPCWVRARLVADALGYDQTCIDNALRNLTSIDPFSPREHSYVWATEFENVHEYWRFDEPPVSIDNVTYACSEAYYQAMKPTPFDKAAWSLVRIEVMTKALRAKFAASKEARDLLMHTYPFKLLSLKEDEVWGYDPHKGGQNLLAIILEGLREELVSERAGKVLVSLRIARLYEQAEAANWDAVWLELVGERELSCLVSRYVHPGSGCTLLHHAAHAGNENATRILIRLGASLFRKSAAGETPRDVATRRGHAVLAAIFEEAEFSIQEIDSSPDPHVFAPTGSAGGGGIRYAFGDILAGGHPIPRGSLYAVDSFGRVAVGWHGSIPPADMACQALDVTESAFFEAGGAAGVLQATNSGVGSGDSGGGAGAGAGGGGGGGFF